MGVYPVIMCGGSGTRLWPVSRPERPKQFAPILGGRSTFQEAVARVTGMSQGREPLVVAGVAHADFVEAQLADLDLPATLLLEPQPRDSAAAIAAAAAWIEAHEPGAVAAIVSADHHIPDEAGFRSALETAAQAAAQGLIVTLGMQPTAPSTAFGYIRPARDTKAVKAVEAFVEKPDAATARGYVEDGYLWNSGVFVAPAAILLQELELFAPGVVVAARKAVAEVSQEGGLLVLGPSFLDAPKISIDYAVMEKTRRAAVLPIALEWTDIGAWSAVMSASSHDLSGNCVIGDAFVADATDCLVRAYEGAAVAVVGARNLAVVVERDAVLVCDLSQSQAVKGVGEHFRSFARPRRRFANLNEAAAWFRAWLQTAALPLWWSNGADHEAGGFREVLTPTGAPAPAKRRARVQARQAFVYAAAGELGWPGPWRQAASHGLDYLISRYERDGGLIAGAVSDSGAPLDDEATLYDLAFFFLAMATLHARGASARNLAADAWRRRTDMEVRRHGAGGFREAGPHPFQANAHMHLFEAALAWEEAGETCWSETADEIADLALRRFIDPDAGFLLEFFDPQWSPAPGDDGRFLEPGHQFEWAWLLERWGRARGREDARAAAARLFEAGTAGVDERRDVAINAVWSDLSVRDDAARLWPQTERLKAALILGREQDALRAAHALHAYLETPARGVWRDRMRADGSFVEEPAPASSFYHIMSACRELFAAVGA